MNPQELVLTIGSLATALIAMAGVVFGIQRWAVRQIKDMVREATEPLRKNGGSSVGDLPEKFAAIQKQVNTIEERQQLIKAALLESGVVKQHHAKHQQLKGSRPGEYLP